MKINKIIVSLIIFCASLALAQSNQFIAEFEKENFKPQLKASKSFYPGDQSFDVSYYKLNLNITYNPNYLTGIVTVEGKAEQDINSIFLDFNSVLDVDSILSNSKQLLFNRSQNKINIDFDSIYNKGELFSVRIYYQGVPNSSGLGSFVFGTHGNNQPAIWTLSEPYGASDWWPCKDTPADKADSSDVLITCSKNLIPVSNGTLTEIIDNGNSHTYKWSNSYPIAHYLISLAIADYTIYKRYFHYSQNDSMPVIHYIYPETFLNVKSELDKTINMLEIFTEKFGPYPFLREKYGHAQFGWPGGMEHQTISSMGAFGEGIISHELAHQWFGDKITCETWNHIWLNEGFASFAEGVFFGAFHGINSYKNYIAAQMENAKKAVGTIYVQDISSVDEIFDSRRTYSKGAVVLHMLKGITGDSIFYEILKNYARDPSAAYGTAVTEDFQQIAENVYGSSLEYFFQEWIYGVNYPKYTISWSSNFTGGSNYEILLDVDQEVNSNPAYFTMPIQIKITTSLGDTLITVFNNQQNQQFNFAVNGNPGTLVFDPNNLILKDLSISTSVVLEEKLFDFALEQNYPNPFNPETNISYQIPADGLVTLKIYDTLGEEITTLVNEFKAKGKYSIKFSGSSLASGIYVYRLTWGDFSSAKIMTLLK